MLKKVGIILGLVFGTFLVIAVIIPLGHDFIFDKYTVKDYELKTGVVTDVRLKKEKSDSVCEHIYVDDYDIFVKCGEDYKQQFEIGQETKYYVYKGKAYHTEAQMKSATPIGKIIDYGMMLVYLVIAVFFLYDRGKLTDFIDRVLTKK